MGEFHELNFADGQLSDKIFAHFDPHFSPILIPISQRKKKNQISRKFLPQKFLPFKCQAPFRKVSFAPVKILTLKHDF